MTVAGALLLSAASFGQSLLMVAQEDFRRAAETYRGAVVPLCMPDVVRAYNDRNAKRDRAFAKSLRHTELARIYAGAVSTDRPLTGVVHCFGPPAPPGTPAPTPEELARRNADQFAQHFSAGNAAFARLVKARDAYLILRRK